MALDTLTARARFQFEMIPGRTLTGSGNIGLNVAAAKTMTFSLGTGALQGNELYGELLTISTSATNNLDLNGARTNLAGSATVTVARVKAILIWLLATTDTAPDGSTTGTACSSITVGAAASNPCALGFGDAASNTWTIYNGDF